MLSFKSTQEKLWIVFESQLCWNVFCDSSLIKKSMYVLQYRHAKAKIIPIVRAGLINDITRSLCMSF